MRRSFVEATPIFLPRATRTLTCVFCSETFWWM